MYDKAKVLAGIIIFLGLFTSPLWFDFASGQAGQAPEIVISPEAKAAEQCIEATAYMRANHMDLLNQWRNAVVRNGNRQYRAGDGKTYTMSLSNTCLKCHSNKAQFCDRCHNFEAVAPKCFDCHLNPGDFRR